MSESEASATEASATGNTAVDAAPAESADPRRRRITIAAAATVGALALATLTGWAVSGHGSNRSTTPAAVPPAAAAASPSASPSPSAPESPTPSPSASESPSASPSPTADAGRSTARSSARPSGPMDPREAAMLPGNKPRPTLNSPYPGCNCTIVHPSPILPSCGWDPAHPCIMPAASNPAAGGGAPSPRRG